MLPMLLKNESSGMVRKLLSHRYLVPYAKLTFGLTCTGSPLGSVIQSFLSSATFCPDTPIFPWKMKIFFSMQNLYLYFARRVLFGASVAWEKPQKMADLSSWALNFQMSLMTPKREITIANQPL